MNILKREALMRANHDGRAALFVKRAHRNDKLCPGDVVMVESSNNLTNPDHVTNFLGICIAIHRRGIDTSFILRNIVLKTGVEIKFKVFSPLVKTIKILRKGTKYRKSKLYFLRERKGSIIKSKSAKKLSEAFQLSQLAENNI
ncbi:hypothetical protein BB561_005895 [Smittium simulii]|uniref:Ribosomal protein L19 n=1 Tax=Smittium simulii TaxID=133385 RepID=A0A2T9Y7T7_9FUNG|nr:hypothetical protein BB561_005895 [Smittium simulii]